MKWGGLSFPPQFFREILMSFADFKCDLPRIKVTASWATAANIFADFTASTKMVVGSGKTLTITMWEGPDDSDDWGVYAFTDTTASISTAFSSLPAVGDIVYCVAFSYA